MAKSPTVKQAEAKLDKSALLGSADYKALERDYRAAALRDDALVIFASGLITMFNRNKSGKLSVDHFEVIAEREQNIREAAFQARFGKPPKKRRQNKSDLKRVLQFAMMAGSIAAWNTIKAEAVNWSYCKGTIARVLDYTGTGDDAKPMPGKAKLASLATAERKSRNKPRTRTGAKKLTEGALIDSVMNLTQQYTRRFKKGAAFDYMVAALKSIETGFDKFAGAQAKAALKAKVK